MARQPNQDPPLLPISGDASFMLLDKERHFPVDLPDLKEFGIGKGELSTGSIEIAEGVEAQLDVGAHNPPRARRRLGPHLASDEITTGQADLVEAFREHDVELPGGVAQIDPASGRGAARQPDARVRRPRGPWFIVTQQLQPGDAMPPDGAPEFLG